MSTFNWARLRRAVEIAQRNELQPLPVTAEEAERHNRVLRAVGLEEFATMKAGDLAYPVRVR